MKKILLAILAIVVFVALLSSLSQMSTKVVVGDQFQDSQGRVVTIEYLGRGDSILAQYPGVFTLSDDQLHQSMVVFSRDGQRFAMNAIHFKQKFEHVNTRVPAK